MSASDASRRRAWLTDAPMPTPKPFTGSELRRQVRITGFDLTADGEDAVYARQTIERDRYRSRLWRVAVRGGRPEQLTSAEASDGRPRISPNGTRLAFLSDRTEKTQVWVMPLDGGEPRMIEGFPDGVTAAEWAPDGRRLAVVAPSGVRRFTVGDPKDPTARRVTTPFWRLDEVGVLDQLASVWIVDADRTAKPKRLTGTERGAGGPAWSPDGRTIGLLASTPDGTIEGELPQPFRLTVAGARLRSLPTFPGGTHALAWSAGGRLAASADPRPIGDAWQNSGLFVLEDGAWRRLGEALDRPVGNTNYGDMYTSGLLGAQEPVWLDEEHILVPISDRGTVPLVRFGLDGSIERIIDGELVVIEHRVGGGRVVAAATTRGRPPELFESSGGRLRRITSDGGRWFGPFQRDPERVSTFGRGSIDAWLLRGGRGRRPTVVQIHGGPHAMHAGTPWLDMVAVASAGFHVVYANPSGSLGYGEALARRLHGDWGGPDTREILRLLDALATDGIVDLDRVGAMGASYGGYLVNWLAGHQPDRFHALVSEQPVADHVSEWGGADFPYEIAEAAVGEHRIPQRVESLVEASPYRTLHKAKAAVLLLHADGDLRCPPVNTDIAFAVLHRAGVPVEMVRYPDEPHGLKTNGRPDRRADRIDRIVAWFREHL